MQAPTKITLKQLKQRKYRCITCYPTCTPQEFKQRLQELQQLNITTIELTGQKHINNLPILGKGYVGIVVKANSKEQEVALKMRRIDSDRATMHHEAQMLREANRIDIGPKLLEATNNFLVMEYIQGTLLPEWITMFRGRKAKEKLCQVLHLLLEQAYKLDNAGLDHGELSHAPKHIIIKPDNTPCIVDFETASTSRHVANVTSLCQYLFIGSTLSKVIHKRLGYINREDLINALRYYKEERNPRNFEEILKVCNI